MSKTIIVASLLERAAAIPVELVSTGWYGRLPAVCQKDLDELKRAYKSGKLPGRSRNWLRSFVNEQLGLSLSRSAFDSWFQK